MINQFSRDPELQTILKSFEKNPFQFTDEEIVSHVDGFLPSYSCDGAACGYFSIIAHICYFRPDLIRQLMKIATKPVFYYGISDPNHAIRWVQYKVKRKNIFGNNIEYYTTKQGKLWIDTELIKTSNLIANLIEEIKREDNIEADE
ncbi:hypothetical protein GC102_33240 [Paenibacillus sp. LMG 31460]|uniref:Uncharacterized protein n=1 Tax=Paenibacillus germinis TaxID=2654979 RepID=A0ABX1ZB34_9BACL|nr:hypothetical protein [Paenibacillus germinis]NOU90565.1 hypothetical protein [Paenibacillus germinis]